MLKSAFSALCKFGGCRALCQKLIDTGMVHRVQGLHITQCPRVLHKDHPGKKAADKYRMEQDTETSVEADPEIQLQNLDLESVFPTIETHSMAISGVRFDELPIIHIKATHNNTLITATDGAGVPVANESGGTVGFRNARKGTNIAAQAAGIALAEKVTKRGIDLVRVCVNGIGPGRLPAIKGLQMSGVTVVSITDTTRLPHNGNRPKKQRRL